MSRKVGAILISYLASAIAATLAALFLLIAIGLAEGRSGDMSSNFADMVEIIGPALGAVLFLAAIPFALSLLALRAMRQTGWPAHTLAGAGVALVALALFIPEMVTAPQMLAEIWYLPVAGAIGGLTYWLCRYRWLREMAAS